MSEKVKLDKLIRDEERPEKKASYINNGHSVLDFGGERRFAPGDTVTGLTDEQIESYLKTGHIVKK